MKIKDLTVTVFDWPGLPVVRYGSNNPVTAASGQIGLVSLVTDEGVTGHAFLGSSYRSVYLDVESLIRHLKPIVIGRNALDRERLFQDLSGKWKATTLRAIGAVDVALWDIAGKAAGQPVHRLLGTYRDRLPAYASSSTLAETAAYVDQVHAVKAAGFRAYKIHPPEDLAQCIEVCTAVRRAAGDAMTLMIDPAGAFDFPQAVRMGRVLEELRFHWYEDPLGDTDIYNYVKLRQKLDIPIMATEYAPGGFAGYAPWIMAQATDYLRADVAVKGGLTAVMKIAHLAEAFRMNMEIHHGGNSLCNVANLHAAMAIANTEYFEILLPAEAQRYGLVQDIEMDADGCVRAFDGPGLGAEIDFALIERRKLAVLS